MYQLQALTHRITAWMAVFSFLNNCIECRNFVCAGWRSRVGRKLNAGISFGSEQNYNSSPGGYSDILNSVAETNSACSNGAETKPKYEVIKTRITA